MEKGEICMWPLGSYDRLVHEIKRRENQDIPVTFGLLIADYDQHRCREYILNYIDVFNYKSGEFINFYLPGYKEENHSSNCKQIFINDKEYYFDRRVYMEFLRNLEVDFKVEYPYNPVLILLQYEKGHFSNSKRIIIELDSDGSDVKKTGALFEKIFNISREVVALDDFSRALITGELRDGLFDTIVNGIGNSYLSAVIDQHGKSNRYRLKSV